MTAPHEVDGHDQGWSFSFTDGDTEPSSDERSTQALLDHLGRALEPVSSRRCRESTSDVDLSRICDAAQALVETLLQTGVSRQRIADGSTIRPAGIDWIADGGRLADLARGQSAR